MYAVGVYFMFTDPQARKLNSDSQSYIGDIYAFAGAGCCALFNLINKEGVEELHPVVALTHNFVVGMILQFLIFPFFVDPLVFFSFDPQLGAFGWLMNPNSFVLLIFIVAPITGVLANLGFYAAYDYFPAEIVASTMLVEPFFAQIAGVMLSQDHVPGIKTIIGLIVITLGFIIAGIGSSLKNKTSQTSDLYQDSYNDDIEYYTRLD